MSLNCKIYNVFSLFGICRKDAKVLTAVTQQFDFIKDKFLPLVNNLKRPEFVMSNLYLGAIFGRLRSKEFEQLKVNTINNFVTIKRYIYAGKQTKLQKVPSLCLSSFLQNMERQIQLLHYIWICTYAYLQCDQLTA